MNVHLVGNIYECEYDFGVGNLQYTLFRTSLDYLQNTFNEVHHANWLKMTALVAFSC